MPPAATAKHSGELAFPLTLRSSPKPAPRAAGGGSQSSVSSNCRQERYKGHASRDICHQPRAHAPLTGGAKHGNLAIREARCGRHAPGGGPHRLLACPAKSLHRGGVGSARRWG